MSSAASSASTGQVGSNVSNKQLRWREYSEEEVVEHNSESDCWLIIHGKVYDVTTFLEDHPGGPEILIQHAGTDCTTDFEEVFHSDAARKQLDYYVIGSVKGYKGDGSDNKTNHSKQNSQTAAGMTNKQQSNSCDNNASAASTLALKNLVVVGALAVLVAAGVVYQFLS